ncbi:MAG: hypothetical protein ACRDIF_02350 [Actinomycetota bacterium]
MASVQQVYERYHPSRLAPSAWQARSWLFMRISGLGLVLLVLGHVAIMHVISGGVDRIDFDFVAARWAGVFWRAYDFLILALALTHGAIGAATVIQDYVRPARWRALLKTVLYSATFLFGSLGAFVIATFQAPGG